MSFFPFNGRALSVVVLEGAEQRNRGSSEPHRYNIAASLLAADLRLTCVQKRAAVKNLR
jgi:hypothetical protein